MKIVTDTPDILVVEIKPWAMGLFSIVMMLLCAAMAVASVAFGTSLIWPMLVCILFFGACFGLLTRRSQLVFSATEGWVELRDRTLFGYSAVRHDLDEIAHADVETRKGIDGTTYSRMYLVIKDGQSAGHHPFPRAFRKWGAPGRTARAVNDWLGRLRG